MSSGCVFCQTGRFQLLKAGSGGEASQGSMPLCPQRFVTEGWQQQPRPTATARGVRGTGFFRCLWKPVPFALKFPLPCQKDDRDAESPSGHGLGLHCPPLSLLVLRPRPREGWAPYSFPYFPMKPQGGLTVTETQLTLCL